MSFEASRWRLRQVAAWRRTLDDRVSGAVDRVASAVVSHWLLSVNVALGIFALLPLLAPVFMEIGWAGAASAIYWAYQVTCHQLPERTHFIFGYQMAYCARDTAIYTAAFVTSVAYAVLREKVPTLDWRLYVLLATPMALDGFSQLLGWRESTAALRTFTGVVFGAASVWFVFPYANLFMAKAQQEPS